MNAQLRTRMGCGDYIFSTLAVISGCIGVVYCGLTGSLDPGEGALLMIIVGSIPRWRLTTEDE